MGGGAVWRGVTRLATTVTPAVRPASRSTSSCSFCKINAAAQAAKASSSKMHSCACTPETTPKAGYVSQGAKSMWDSDEWEFAEEEDKIDHLVFGPIPSRQEVEEASSELQNALRLGLEAPSYDNIQAPTSWGTLLPTTAGQFEGSQQSGSPSASRHSKCSETTEEKDTEEVSRPLLASKLALDWVEPPPIRTGQNALQAGGRSAVQEAFHQFQHNSEVQNMVVSLASDPNVWDAVLQNEKIQEFKRKLQGEKAFFVDKADGVTEVESDPVSESTPNFFERCQIFWRTQILQFMDVLNGLIMNLFKAADKKIFAEEDGDTLNRTVKSCTMLALVVLCVVILKRISVQAA
ncbi:hypothetical protein Mapa_010310 [Marchantia paleacea]|nr:hypothetical protein Mapa_010310 [Marchantia paleacea]